MQLHSTFGVFVPHYHLVVYFTKTLSHEEITQQLARAEEAAQKEDPAFRLATFIRTLPSAVAISTDVPYSFWDDLQKECSRLSHAIGLSWDPLANALGLSSEPSPNCSGPIPR